MVTNEVRNHALDYINTIPHKIADIDKKMGGNGKIGPLTTQAIAYINYLIVKDMDRK